MVINHDDDYVDLHVQGCYIFEYQCCLEGQPWKWATNFETSCEVSQEHCECSMVGLAGPLLL